MVIEAFVLPYLGRSVGVVFWEPRRAVGRRPAGPVGDGPGSAPGAGRRAAGSEPDTFAVYGTGELSPGEVAELEACYVASLGGALREGAYVLSAGWLLFWWWLIGGVAALILGLGALEVGPGYAWIALAAAATALPAGAAGVAWPVRGRRLTTAQRLARRAPWLVPARGADPRAQERLDGLWRIARRLQGPASTQLRELEAYCREQAWRPAARFYADQQARLAPAATTGRVGRLVPGGAWRARLWAWLRGLISTRPPYAVLEMRSW
jgi:hypothetical protein